MENYKKILESDEPITLSLFAKYMIDTFFKGLPIKEIATTEELLKLLMEHLEKLKEDKCYLFSTYSERNILFKKIEKVIPERLKDIMGELTKLGYECKIDSIAFDDNYNYMSARNNEINVNIYFPIDLTKNTKWLIDFDSCYYINNRNDEIYTIDNLKEERSFISKCINKFKKEMSKFDEFKKKYDLYDFELYEKGKLKEE